MRIAMFGAGGIGGYLAAKLAGAGEAPAVIARGAHLAAMRDGGLRLAEPEGEIVARLPVLTEDPAEVGEVDLVVMAVKGQDLPGALEAVAPMVGAGTKVLPFQNGVDAPRLVAEAFGEGAALTGVARIFANITAPGVVTRHGGFASFVIGTAAGSQDDAGVAAIRERLGAAGVSVPDCPDVRVDLWRKFILFNAMSSITAAARCRVGDIRRTPELTDFARGLVEETCAVGRALGVALADDAVEKTLAVIEGLPGDSRTSTAHDLAEGKPLEIDWICGAVVRLGREAGVETPRSAACHALLAPWREGAPAAGA